MTVHRTWARLRPIASIGAVYLLIGAVLRVALWYSFGRPAEVSAIALPAALLGGSANDAVAALYLLAPMAVFLSVLPDRPFDSRWAYGLRLAAVFLFLAVVGFLAVVEYYFFQEFDARFNIVSVDYLLYPTEVVGDVRAEYPLVPVLVSVCAAAVAVLVSQRHRLVPRRTAPSRLPGRALALAGYGALVVLAAFTSDTDVFAVSGNRVTDEIVANGTSSFFRALRTSEIDYHDYYATRDPSANMVALRSELARSPGTFVDVKGGLDRRVAARGDGLGRLNVVVVVSESMGAEFSQAFGGEHHWTPVLDQLAAESLMFTNMYASGTRTARGLEAIAASIPPIPTTSILHRPGSDGIANWGAVMRAHGYHTSFIYGGYSQFDDMDSFFAGNGFEVHDRRDIDRPVRFENVWGVSDEDLYDLATRQFDRIAAGGQPFFSVIMSTSNHKPYTFRSGVPGVKASGGGRESGVRYADFAQGYFLQQAATHRWFDDTLFVIVADHGARVYGREEIPLKSYRIPMLFYSPTHLTPGRVEALTTQIDVAPTVLGLLGLPYTAPFFGQDVLHAPSAGHVAFFSHNHDVAVYRDGQLAILGLHKSISDVSYDPRTDSYAHAKRDASLEDLGIAYYQTAYELFRAHRYLPSGFDATGAYSIVASAAAPAARWRQ